MISSPKALHPRYAERFKCTGPACEDTCCRSWQIPIDRVTFEKYRALPQSALTPIFEASLVLRIHPAPAAVGHALASPDATEISQDSASASPEPAFGSVHPDAFYGQITLLPDGACPFLSTESMCRIQTELGKDHLSQVCDSYPRISRKVDASTETSLLLSCPEAARQVLLDRRFMHLPRTAPGGHARYTPLLDIAASLALPNGNPLQYLMEIRHLLFLIVKDRSYPLWQRLFIIGLFSKRLTDIQADIQTNIHAESHADVPANDRAPRTRDTVAALLRSYAELLAQGRLRSTMDAVPANAEAQLSVVLKLLDARGAIGPIPPRLLECFQAFMAGIAFNPKGSLLEISNAYRAAYATQFEPFLVKNGHLFENYLLSYIIRNRFPFGDDTPSDTVSTTPQQEFALMALRYSFLNALAAGMAGKYRDSFHADHVVKLVQSFSKSFEHNRAIREKMLSLIAEYNLTASSGIAMLLRV